MTCNRATFTGTPTVGMIVTDFGRKLRLIKIVGFNKDLGKHYCMFQEDGSPHKVGFFI